MQGCVIDLSPNLDKFTFSLAPLTFCNYCVIQMLDIIQQQQQQEYPILGPRRYANRGQKYEVLFKINLIL